MEDPAADPGDPPAQGVRNSGRPRELWRDRGVWALLGAAALLRLVVGADLWAHDPLARVPLSDAAYYLDWARALAAGESFHELDARPYWLPPLYPWLLSLPVRLGLDVGGLIALQLSLGWICTAGVLALGWRFAGRGAGLAAGWLWTLSLPVIFFETRLLAVNAAVPLALGCLLCLQEWERRGAGARAWAGLAGALLGLACLARPNLLLAAPAALLALALSQGQRARRGPLALAGAVFAAGVLLGVSPALVHNARQGELVPVTANGGVNFWMGNNAQARGTFHAPGPEWGDIRAQRSVSLARASEAAGRPLGEREASAWWMAEGRAWLFAEPAAAAALWARKLADHLSSFEFGIQYVPSVQRALAPSTWLLLVPHGLLLGLAVLGARGAGAGRAQLWAWLGAGLLASLLYFTYSRFRLPLLPALLPFAGRGWMRLWEARGGGPRPGLLACAAALALCAQSFVDFEPEVGGAPYRAHLQANSWADMGWRDEDPERSRAHFERSLALIEANPKALHGLARAARAANPPNEREALQRLNAARALSEDGAILHDLAWLLIGAGDPLLRDPQRAVGLLREWIGRHAPSTPLYDELVVLLGAAVFDNPALASDPREARRLFEQVRARQPEHPAANAALMRMDGVLRRDG